MGARELPYFGELNCPAPRVPSLDRMVRCACASASGACEGGVASRRA